MLDDINDVSFPQPAIRPIPRWRRPWLKCEANISGA